MCRRSKGFARSRAAFGAIALMLLCAPAASLAQAPPPSPPPPNPTEPAPSIAPSIAAPTPVDVDPRTLALEAYLEDNELWDVLAAQLRTRLRDGPPGEKAQAAERLGRLYVKMLGVAKTNDTRRALEEKARELLKSVPDSEAFELRIDLAKASYLKAQEIAERHRIRLASIDEQQEALRILGATRPVFTSIGQRIETRVNELERRERRAADDELAAIRSAVADARRVRSLSHYYAAWSTYYVALLGGDARELGTALVEFGYVLNAVPGRPPTIDRLPKALLHYEHVARAVLGVALCISQRGGEGDALAWIDQLQDADEINPAIEKEVFAARIAILAAAGRWNDVEFRVNMQRRPGRETPATPLPVGEARLLVVLGLEAVKSDDVRENLRPIAERTAQIGFADLIARGEVSQVLDLVSRYGTAPIGDTGFVVQYVRGLQAYERARASHKAADTDVDLPTSSNPVANEYREASKLLAAALDSTDATKFESERGRALTRRGLALFYAGDLAASAEVFEEAYTRSTDLEQRRDALWFAVVALDRAVESGKPSLESRRDRVSQLFLQQFPASENAAKLLLRRAQAGLMSEEETLKVLLAVPEESPIYAASRRQAAVILYRAYRRAAPANKPFAAARFTEIAEPVVKLEAARARAGTDAVSRDSAQGVLLLVRQLVDAQLASAAPDVAHVDQLLDLLDNVASFHRLDIAPLEGELAFRRLQISIARNDAPTIEKQLLRLRRSGGDYALAADRLLFKRALDAWRSTPSDMTLAKQVVRHGLVVLEKSSRDAALATRLAIAEASAAIWRAEQDKAELARAVALDKESIKSGGKTAETLKRLGELAEAAGDTTTALDCWRELFAALPADSAEWFEARYHSARLLWSADQKAAFEAMEQHKLLYPSFGPEPWGDKLRALYAEFKSQMPEPTPSPAPAPKSGGAK